MEALTPGFAIGVKRDPIRQILFAPTDHVTNCVLVQENQTWTVINNIYQHIKQMLPGQVVLEGIAANFGKWETANADDDSDYAMDCHGHIHMYLSRAAVDELSALSRAAVDKPSAAVDKPSAAVDKPSAAVDKPSAAVDKPSAAVDKPSAAVDKPSAAVDKPSAAVDKPSAAVDKPSALSPAAVDKLPALDEKWGWRAIHARIKNPDTYLESDCRDLEVCRLISAEHKLLRDDMAVIKNKLDAASTKEDLARFMEETKKDAASTKEDLARFMEEIKVLLARNQ